MSNLKLPSMDFVDLLEAKKFKDRWGKLGYQTYAKVVIDRVMIAHHGNTIAELRAYKEGVLVYITDAGWGSVTTRDRLNRILRDNNVPAYVCQRNNEQKLYWRNDETSTNLWSEERYGYSTFHSALFARKYFTDDWKVIPR